MTNDTPYNIQIRDVNEQAFACKSSREQTGTPKALTAPVGQTVPADWRLIPQGSEGNPIFGPGQSFRLMFLTYGKMTAESINIGACNKLVKDQAGVTPTDASAPTLGESLAELVLFKEEFYVLMSTATVDTRDNAATTGRGVPIHWVRDGSIGDGDKVANDYADFYDGAWDLPADAYHQSGHKMTHGVAWTGSHDNGTKDIPHLGSSFFGGVCNGSIIRPGERIHGAENRRERLHRLFAISPVLTVAAVN